MGTKAKLITTGFHVHDQQPGDYALGEKGKGIMAILPCGDFFYDSEGKWEYKDREDENKITVTPSIFCHGINGKGEWHGFLTNGVFTQV